MPLINGCKYSCEPCIRGHRATSCAHTDILIEVRKPGRPLESCGHGLDTCDCGRVEELLSVPMNDSFSSPLDLLPTAGPESCIAVKTPHSVTTGLSNAKSPGFDRVQSRISKKTKKKSTSPFSTLEVAMGSHKPSSNLNEYFENFTQPLNAVCNTKPCSQGIQDQRPFLQAAKDDLSFSKAFPETGSGPYTPPAEYVPYQTS